MFVRDVRKYGTKNPKPKPQSMPGELPIFLINSTKTKYTDKIELSIDCQFCKYSHPFVLELSEFDGRTKTGCCINTGKKYQFKLKPELIDKKDQSNLKVKRLSLASETAKALTGLEAKIKNIRKGGSNAK